MSKIIRRRDPLLSEAGEEFIKKLPAAIVWTLVGSAIFLLGYNRGVASSEANCNNRRIGIMIYPSDIPRGDAEVNQIVCSPYDQECKL